MNRRAKQPGKFEKVGECLYRYSSNGAYYAVVRHEGKLIRRSLETDASKPPKRSLADFKKCLSKVDSSLGKMTIEELLKKIQATLKTLDANTIQKLGFVADHFRKSWAPGMTHFMKCILKPFDWLSESAGNGQSARPGVAAWRPLVLTGVLAGLLSSGCHKEAEAHKEVESKLTVSRPLKRDTLITHNYVCQIHSNRNIEIRALEQGYLKDALVKEGQHVKEGGPMFQILPLIYQAELKQAEADAQVAEVEYENTKRLAENKVVSNTELAMAKAKWNKTLAEVNLAQAHLSFTDIKAPFPGLVDRLMVRKGSLVEEGDLLTTLSDNSEMWVYFNVPEAEYLDYTAKDQPEEWNQVSLIMANGKMFDQPGRINTIEAQFNNKTGTIPFRADFPNPDGRLRHGETGNIQIKKLVKGALLIPQKSTFQILDHHFVYLVGKNDVLTQQRILVSAELEDLFIVSGGLTENDKFVLEGLRQAKSGTKADYSFVEPKEAFNHLQLHAE